MTESITNNKMRRTKTNTTYVQNKRRAHVQRDDRARDPPEYEIDTTPSAQQQQQQQRETS